MDRSGAPAVDPNMRNFTQWRHFVDEQVSSSPETLRGKTVLMFCTGGIRCESASAYLKGKGACERECVRA